MCTKIITVFYYGFPQKEQCTRPDAEGGSGLCVYHLRKAILKSSTWGKRRDYEQVSEEAMRGGIAMKLKTENSNVNYKLRGQTIIRYNADLDQYEKTDLPADVNLFCVKK